MKKLLPSLEELIDRYSHQIQLRNPQIPITENGKKLLSETWQGKEQRLYEKVKDMENKNVQYENIKKTIDHREVQFQVGVDFLGFPIYTIHEVVFQNHEVRKEFRNQNVPCQSFMGSRQYNVKQH